ncbi:MAG: hypothetical protein LUH07_04385, partial [Lachnospiraceae bacterium]|nr:hypothetical protein [Lachnospiraceae bacterium]
MADMEINGNRNHNREADAAQESSVQGDRQAKMKEEEYMQKNQDPDAIKKTEEKAVDKPAQKPAPPKKKNIIQVFRPQNSKTGMVKPGGRPRPQGTPGGRSQSGARSHGAAGTRPQGAAAGTAAGTRPQGAAAGTAAGTR